MAAQILDFHHSTGPAPAYAIESDSEDDQWPNEPIQGGERQKKSSGEERDQSELGWQPAAPGRLEFPGQSGLLVLIGDAGLLVASGLPQDLRSSSQSFIQLDQYLLLSQSASFALSPRYVPLNLQFALARKLLADIRPPGLTIISTYQASTYIPSSENLPVRYLASTLSDPSSSLPHSLETLGCHHFQVPNLIKGFEAALMIQANILRIDSKIILLPAISILHDDKSSTSIPAGQYDFSSGSLMGGADGPRLPASLLGLDHPGLRQTLAAVVDQYFLNHRLLSSDQDRHDSPPQWRFPSAVESALSLAFRAKLNLDLQLKPKPPSSATVHHELGLMYM